MHDHSVAASVTPRVLHRRKVAEPVKPVGRDAARTPLDADSNNALVRARLAILQRTAGNQAAVRFLGKAACRHAPPRPVDLQRQVDATQLSKGDKIRAEGGDIYVVESVHEQVVVAERSLGRPSSPATVEFVAGSATDTYTKIDPPAAPTSAQGGPPPSEKGEPSSNSNTTWDSLERTHNIDKASPLLQPLEPVKTLHPEFEAVSSSSKGKGAADDGVAFVANILTVPSDAGIQPIISAYAEQGMTKAFWPHFAMVIGVNRYRSLRGDTVDRLERAVGTATDAPFPTAVVPFMWDFEWSQGFEAAQEAFRTLDAGEQKKALDYERAHLVQSTIPYGSLREYVTKHERTRTFVGTLAKSHGKVYIHLGDDDARSLQTKLGPLIEGYAGLGAAKEGAPLIVGGYEFRAEEEGGDLKGEAPGELITALGSRIEIWFRGVLAQLNPDLVYPTEPNLVFLAAHGGAPGPYTALLQPASEAEKRLATEEKRERERYPKLEAQDLYFTTGVLYGRNANEGGKLRDRITDVIAAEQASSQKKGPRRGGPQKGAKARGSKKGGTGPAPAPVTVYEPRLGIATASTRFTVRDDEHIQHDRAKGRYGVRREEAYASTGGTEAEKLKAYKKRVLQDVLEVKQSHISGLAKELTGHPDYKKQATAIGKEVLAAVVALLSGEQPPASKVKEAKPFLEAIEKGKTNVAGLKGQLDATINAMAARYAESLKRQASEGSAATAATVPGNSNGSGDSQREDLVTTSS